MAETPVSLYEGLFLLNPSAVAADLNVGLEHLRGILDRAEAEVLVVKKWGERKLAYKINKQRRGLYFLVYFKASHDRIAGIDRDCNLSEIVMRSMVLRADHIGEVELDLAKEDADLSSVEAKLHSDLSTPVSVAPASADQKGPATETPSETATVDA